MDIAARLSTIPQLLQNLENTKLELEQMSGVLGEPLFINFVGPAVSIQDHIFLVQNEICRLENRKGALLEEQQSLTVMATHHSDRRRN
uniref:K-box domain-containing protein n=1 Tax=Leersia perrieri TaxID=77586 RepID=A0A0D9WNJ2_9ORYZ